MFYSFTYSNFSISVCGQDGKARTLDYTYALWLDVATPPLCRNFQQNDHNATMLGADSSPRVLVDSGTQRSTGLCGEAVANTNTASTVVSGNGTSNSSKYLEGSKRSSMALRSVTNCKQQARATGIVMMNFDDSHTNITSATSASLASGGARCLKLEEFPLPVGGITMNGSRVYSGMSEILGLLGILGEGNRLPFMYRCQDALDVYLKLPRKHPAPGWTYAGLRELQSRVLCVEVERDLDGKVTAEGNGKILAEDVAKLGSGTEDTNTA
ncbi:hypothetical protein FEM48_Zijuj01G0334100 [Ziziphus jujuba var. spinosa]|uniref:Uncharacterized protein n=1 Tax=Ziziphus jujuba var. spinosa TaxID=714518 RepID=A0A978W6S9_ZIZJJ|nr:hypothetical protein FEM48_Zijuj01G0334100 [Ziziphus jujuba var. spinosa]